jgi:trimeric autotransporter adhesin
MTRLRKSLAVAAMALVVGSLAAGCGGSGPVSGAVSSAASAAKSAASSLRPTGGASLPASAPTPTAEAPASQAPAPTAAAAASPAAGGSSSSLLWLWIALAAVVLIGLIVWIARASGRRSAAASARRSAMIDTYAKGQALADAIRVADRPGAPGADAGGRWAGLQARADDLSRELYRLRESSSDEGERMRMEDALGSLRALRSALADEQAAGGAGGPGSPEAAQVRARLMSFEESLRALRAPYEQMPRI